VVALCRYKRWTDEETENLRQGVDRWGTKWAKILQSYDFNERTGVDLKDRWRNLSKNA
jgi:telomeric repeat-binding factor 1